MVVRVCACGFGNLGCCDNAARAMLLQVRNLLTVWRNHATLGACVQDPPPSVRLLGRIFSSAEPLPRTLTVRVVRAKLTHTAKAAPSTVVSMVRTFLYLAQQKGLLIILTAVCLSFGPIEEYIVIVVTSACARRTGAASQAYERMHNTLSHRVKT
jgi:hypothetical protein